MYRKDTEGWLKHADFIVLDLVCLQIAYVLNVINLKAEDTYS